MKTTSRDKIALRKHLPILKTIAKANPSKRKNILNNAPTVLFNILKKICRLLINGTISITPNQRRKLTPSVKKVLRAIHTGKNPKNIVIQNGKGIGKVLKSILPIVAQFLGSI